MAARIYGHVDFSTLSPKVNIQLISSNDREEEFSSIVDTGYNGEVILPEVKIQEMGLEFLGTIDRELADGQVVEVELYRGEIKWFETIREIAIGSSKSGDALLGTLLLANCELNVDFKQGSVAIRMLD